MGATTFSVQVKATAGETAQQAFQAAVAQACFASFADAHAMADYDAPAVEDKWGPAGCITVRGAGDTGYLFYGWASE